MEGLTVGRMVHAVEPETRLAMRYPEKPGETTKWVDAPNPRAGQHRAAVVTEVEDAATGRCALFIFHSDSGPELRPGVSYSEGKEPGTWHWIERS